MAAETVFCRACGHNMSAQAEACPQCGHPTSTLPLAPASAGIVGAGGPPKSRVVAGVLGLLIGGFGVHKFYLGKVGLGVVYILFFWTFVPAIIGFIEGIIYLVQSDEEFSYKQGVTVQRS
jgi:TM2 domain-containing membrane protein YozV